MQSPVGANSAAGSQACAVCKYQRRKCSSNCLLAPFFPANRHKDFLNTRKHFGVKNIIKLVENLDFQQRVVAVKSIIFEANVRAKDPVGGCYRVVRELNRQIDWYKAELDLVLQQIDFFKAQAIFTQYQQQQQQQSGQKQQMIQVEDNDQDQFNPVSQGSECFNMYEAIQGNVVQDSYGSSSSLLPVYNVFDSNPVKVEPVSSKQFFSDEGDVNVIQGSSSYGGSSSLLSVYNGFDSNFVKIESSETSKQFLSDVEDMKPFLSNVGEEDMKPMLALFDDKREQTFSFDAEGSKNQCRDELVSKEEAAGSIQHQHDLNDAASLFTLTNGKG